jgi:hypothetical protein
MIASGLATAGEAIFDLDFHAVMHWGHDPALEKHYVPTRSPRARSVLTFFAHNVHSDHGSHNSQDRSQPAAAQHPLQIPRSQSATRSIERLNAYVESCPSRFMGWWPLGRWLNLHADACQSGVGVWKRMRMLDSTRGT